MDEKKCPRCAEMVKVDAQVCRFCGCEFSIFKQMIGASGQKRGNGAGCGVVGVIVLIMAAAGAFNGTPQAAKDDAPTAADRKAGFHCLSKWSGVNRSAERQVKARLRDPDSFKHIETKITPVNPKGVHMLSMEYRAKNGFGGYNVAKAYASVDPTTCEATMITTE